MNHHNDLIDVGFLLIPGFALMSYSAAIEPLRAVNLLAGKEIYRWHNIAITGSDTLCSTGETISCAQNIENAAIPKLLFVCAGKNPFAFKEPKVYAWLQNLARKGVTLGGVSGGPVILAQAQVVGDRRITVHWEHGETLKEMFPQYHIEQSLYVIDRDRITCAGGIAPMDMMHALIAEECGAPFAQKVSDWFLHTTVRSPMGAQKMGISEKYGVYQSTVIDAIEFMQNRMSTPPPLQDIADYVGLSVRQLSRSFLTEIGETPAVFFRDMRLSYSSRLLKQSPLRITEIAYAAGFSSGAHFTKSFVKKYNITPLEYRKNRAHIDKSKKS